MCAIISGIMIISWRSAKRRSRRSLCRRIRISCPRKNEASAGKADWKAQKEEQAKLRKLQNQITRTEAEIEQAEERLAQIDGEFAKPEVATNSARLSELHAERIEIQEKLDGLYELWESLSE